MKNINETSSRMRFRIRRHSVWLMLVAAAVLLPNRLYAQLSVTKIGESLVGTSCSGNALNLRSHQDDAIVSFNGYQYAVYYSIIGTDTSKRYVTIGRRALPDGAWETMMFTDYTQTINDSHNIISLGICEGDGTIHLAFDHHNVDLNYRISVQGLATNPEAHSWVTGKFSAVQDYLPGEEAGRTTGLTYPRFFPKPNGDLQFVRRKGSAIAGKNMIYTYSQTSHTWNSHGVYVDGTIVLYNNDSGETTKTNPYLHGIGYDDNERLHASWVWRTNDGANFDFMYAYSDDYGINWKNNEGQSAGRINDPMTLSNSPPVKVFSFSEGSMLNQTGQAVDSAGRVHVVQKNGAKFRHIYRDTNGVWHENRIESIPADRNKITTDQHGNVYLITESAKIYGATPENNFTDWAVVYDDDAGRFGGDAMFDENRMKREGILSILATKKTNAKEIYSIDLSVSPISYIAPTFGNGGTPGTGDPWSITRSATTRIEVENYDQGDAGAVYSDTTAGNEGGNYRTNDVDISSTSDSGGGYNVGWTKPGEWLQYTVDVEETGLYDVIFRYSRAAAESSALRISMNGGYLPGTIDAPGTGSYATYSTVTNTLALQAGIQALRLHFVDGSINVNWVELVPVEAPPPLVYELIAGWDTWNSATAPAASYAATAIAASATASGTGGNWSTTDSGDDPGRGSSVDTTWGTYDGDGNPASAVTNANGANFTLSNGKTDGEITFTISNTGAQDIELGAFHVDAMAFRANAARAYALNVLAGSDITVGNVFTSADDAITQIGGDAAILASRNGHDDIDLDLTGLTDHTLEAGGTAIIELAFSSGTGSGGGHHLFVDNVGITGAFASLAVLPPLEYGMSGGNMVFSWTGNGFKVQASTNLTSNLWNDIPGGDTPPVNIPPTNPEGFFRLIEQ